MKNQWADGPLKLIETPLMTKDKTNKTVQIATEMALAHNSFFRAMNAIYLQAPGISQATDISDFLIYCQCFFEMISHHHDKEEELFFPAIAQYTGDPDIMETNISAHAAFHSGLVRFGKYVKETTPETYDSQTLKALIDDFSAPLESHMNEEIQSLLSLEKYGGDKLAKAYKSFEDQLVAEADKYRFFPVVFGSHDTTYEGGVHSWPPVPFFVPYVIKYYFGRRHAGAWRFAPCDFFGRPRELQFFPSSS